MQSLSPRHVMPEEALRLGVVSGWYSTKVSGTFVSGPHDSKADCLRKSGQRFIAGWSSPVARQAHNRKVIGSNPIPATK